MKKLIIELFILSSSKGQLLASLRLRSGLIVALSTFLFLLFTLTLAPSPVNAQPTCSPGKVCDSNNQLCDRDTSTCGPVNCVPCSGTYNTCTPLDNKCTQVCPGTGNCILPETCQMDPVLGNSCGGSGGGPGGGSGTTPPANISLPAEPALAVIKTSTGLPTQIVTVFLPAVIIILGFLAVFYIIFAGIRFIISKGDPEKVAEARSRLTYAIVGFIVLLLAFAATQLIDRIFLNSKVI